MCQECWTRAADRTRRKDLIEKEGKTPIRLKPIDELGPFRPKTDAQTLLPTETAPEVMAAPTEGPRTDSWQTNWRRPHRRRK